MVPVRVVGMVELKGGDDDFEEYYCPTIEWNWDDGTISESSNDCEPYERGKSVIKRKYTVTHPYKQGGRYRITFKLKQKQKVVGGANAVVQLLGGGPYLDQLRSDRFPIFDEVAAHRFGHRRHNHVQKIGPAGGLGDVRR